jgi:hypothetical protein
MAIKRWARRMQLSLALRPETQFVTALGCIAPFFNFIILDYVRLSSAFPFRHILPAELK